MMRRPCGECRALVGPSGCEHWRPARKLVVHAPSRRALTRERKARREVDLAWLVNLKPGDPRTWPGSRRDLRRKAAPARQAALEERERRASEFLARHGLTARPAIVHNSSTQ